MSTKNVLCYYSRLILERQNSMENECLKKKQDLLFDYPLKNWKKKKKKSTFIFFNWKEKRLVTFWKIFLKSLKILSNVFL